MKTYIESSKLLPFCSISSTSWTLVVIPSRDLHPSHTILRPLVCPYLHWKIKITDASLAGVTSSYKFCNGFRMFSPCLHDKNKTFSSLKAVGGVCVRAQVSQKWLNSSPSSPFLKLKSSCSLLRVSIGCRAQTRAVRCAHVPKGLCQSVWICCPEAPAPGESRQTTIWVSFLLLNMHLTMIFHCNNCWGSNQGVALEQSVLFRIVKLL